MAKYDYGGGCPCGLQKGCDCEMAEMKRLKQKQDECLHRDWSSWIVAGSDDHSESFKEWHKCRKCGKLETRDTRNGF